MRTYIQVFTAIDKREDAENLAQYLVTKRLAACIQIVGPIVSTYWWKDRVETAKEWLCIIKSKHSLYKQLEQAIRKIHPYAVPEITAMPITAGSTEYLTWLNDETTN
jgi:periplasmic divalent cation tolerance protein